MKPVKPIGALAAAMFCIALAGCGHGNDSSGMQPPPPPPPPPPVAFNDFVKTQFANTADDTDPEAVDDTDFSFDDQDDPNAFDDILSSSP